MSIPAYGNALPSDLYQSLNNPNPYASFNTSSNPYYANSFNSNNALLQSAGIQPLTAGATNINSAADALLFASSGQIATGYSSGISGYSNPLASTSLNYGTSFNGNNISNFSDINSASNALLFASGGQVATGYANGGITGGVNPFGNWDSCGLGGIFSSTTSLCGLADAFSAQNIATIEYGQQQKQAFYDGQMQQAMQVTSLRQQYMAMGYNAQQVTNILQTGSPYTTQQQSSSGTTYNQTSYNQGSYGEYDDDTFWSYILNQGKTNTTTSTGSLGSFDMNQLVALFSQLLGI